MRKAVLDKKGWKTCWKWEADWSRSGKSWSKTQSTTYGSWENCIREPQWWSKGSVQRGFNIAESLQTVRTKYPAKSPGMAGFIIFPRLPDSSGVLVCQPPLWLETLALGDGRTVPPKTRTSSGLQGSRGFISQWSQTSRALTFDYAATLIAKNISYPLLPLCL